MNRRKWQNRTLLLIVIYVFIICLFGFPYVDKDIVSGFSYNKVAQENALTRTFYTFRKVLNPTGLFAIIMAAILLFYQDYFIKRINSKNKAEHAILLTRFSLVADVVTSLSFCILATISFATMQVAKNEVLQEYSRADFMWYTGITFISLYFFINQIKRRNYFSKKSPSAILADNYLREYQKFIKKDNIEKAKVVIAQVCEVDPSGVTPWAVRAVFVDTFLSSPTDAEMYFNKATDNLKKHPNLDDEDKACYEFCLANILLGKDKIEQAESHIRRSLELHYDSDRADFLKKLQKHYKSKL